MKLSDSVEHTSRALDIPHVQVSNVARFAREAELISSTAVMSPDDNLALLVAVCGCETARGIRGVLPTWLALPYSGPRLANVEYPFDFLCQRDFKTALSRMFDE